jgi:CBS domain containing-hemolysin-like protein
LEYDAAIEIPLLLGTLLLSAFFSGSEVAFFSLDRRAAEESRARGGLAGELVAKLLEDPRRLLVSILLGNNLVNVGASILSVSVALRVAEAYELPTEIAVFAQIVALTALILLFGEIIPKSFASKRPRKFASAVAVPLYWICVAVYPVAETATAVIRSIVARVRFDGAGSAMTDEEILHLADLGQEEGAIEESEQELIRGIVAYRNTQTREVMIPRVDMSAISADASFDEATRIVRESGHSRLPVYDGDVDEIVGVLYAKDLLPYLKKGADRRGFKPAKIARKPLYAPETKYISDLMREFQEKKTHLAIVVDEYGGTAGLATFEDVIEEIFGEIRDEFDKEEAPIVPAGESAYLVSGALSAHELDELIGVGVASEEDDYDSVGGFIIHYAGEIPNRGYRVEREGYTFTVKEIVNNRITKVLVEKQ